MKGCLDTVSGLSAVKHIRTFHSLSQITCLHAYCLTQWSLFSWVEHHLKLCNFQQTACAWPTEGQLRGTLQMYEELSPLYCPVRVFLTVVFKHIFQGMPRFLGDLRVYDLFKYSHNTLWAVKEIKLFFLLYLSTWCGRKVMRLILF